MKRLVIAVALAAVGCVQTNAQGTVDFRNRITGVLDLPICDLNGVRISGPDFVAQLYFSATETGSYSPVNYAPAPFRTGTGAGYWNAGADSTRILTGIAGGSLAWLQVRVWNYTLGPTYETATGPRGQSVPFVILTGGGGIPPSSPAFMTGAWWPCIPEPSTLALGVLGLAGLWFLRRNQARIKTR